MKPPLFIMLIKRIKLKILVFSNFLNSNILKLCYRSRQACRLAFHTRETFESRVKIVLCSSEPIKINKIIKHKTDYFTFEDLTHWICLCEYTFLITDLNREAPSNIFETVDTIEFLNDIPIFSHQNFRTPREQYYRVLVLQY